MNAKKQNLKNRAKLIVMAINNSEDEFDFEARILDLKGDWITFSQLLFNNEIIATHFNLPTHKVFFKNEVKLHGQVRIKARASYYMKNGERYGTLIPLKSENKITIDKI